MLEFAAMDDHFISQLSSRNILDGKKKKRIKRKEHYDFFFRRNERDSIMISKDYFFIHSKPKAMTPNTLTEQLTIETKKNPFFIQTNSYLEVLPLFAKINTQNIQRSQNIFSIHNPILTRIHQSIDYFHQYKPKINQKNPKNNWKLQEIYQQTTRRTRKKTKQATNRRKSWWLTWEESRRSRRREPGRGRESPQRSQVSAATPRWVPPLELPPRTRTTHTINMICVFERKLKK